MIKVDYFLARRTNEAFGLNRVRVEQYKCLKQIDKKVIDYNLNNKFIKKYYSILEPFIGVYQILKNKRRKSILHLGVQGDALILNLYKFKPNVINCLDLIPLVYKKEYSIFNRIKNKMIFNATTKADHIITISEYTKKDIIKILGYPKEKITVIYPGVNLEVFKPAKKSKRELLKKFNLDSKYKYIAYLGNEEKRMNIDKQLKAFKLAKKEIRNLKFIKAGKPNTPKARQELLKFIDRENLKEDVLFFEYIPEKDMADFYSMLDLFLYPIEYAGFGLPPLEAMACGCPVITSNLTSLPEVIENAGIQLNPNDVENMSNQIIKLSKDKKLQNKYKKLGLKQAEKFPWNREKELLEVYKKLIRI